MIKDIPARADFDAIGRALLNQAWHDLISLSLGINEAEQWVSVDDSNEYWKAASTKLTTALAIAHQAAEFFIKGRIVEVSPFLLVANSAREWPNADADGQTSYSRFRTVDAQDLVRLHDRCSASPLEESFKAQLENLRVRRNTIMHTVDKGLVVELGELVSSILSIHKNLVGGSWMDFRRAALFESADTKLWSNDWIEPLLIREFLEAEALLSPSQLGAHFGLPAKQRRYICGNCTWDTFADYDTDVASAVLMPNTPTSETLWCAVCDTFSMVVRVDCEEADCPGNVITYEWDKCLTCGFDQTPSGS